MFGDNFIRRASGIYSPALIGLAAPWRFLPCEECCEDGCDQCAGESPGERSVTIDGVANDSSCLAGACEQINDTYVLLWQGPSLNPYIRCSWGSTGLGIPCYGVLGSWGYSIGMSVGVAGGGGYHTSVQLNSVPPGAGPYGSWQSVTPAKPDCTATSGSLALVGYRIGPCDFSSATCDLV